MFSNPVLLQKTLCRKQQEMLVEHLHANKDLARANFDVPQAAKMWQKISIELNTMGYVRTVKEWQQVWIAWCRKTRLKVNNVQKSSLSSGKEAADVFSYIERVVLEILGIQIPQLVPAAKTDDRRASVNVSSVEAPKVMCRLCLSTQKLAPLFGFREYSKSDTLKLATGLEINMDDGLPQFVCTSCSSLLASAIKLRQQSNAAAIWLQKFCSQTNTGPKAPSFTDVNEEIKSVDNAPTDIDENSSDISVFTPEHSNETTYLTKNDPTHLNINVNNESIKKNADYNEEISLISDSDDATPPNRFKTQRKNFTDSDLAVNVNQLQPKIPLIKLTKPLLPVGASDLRPNIFTTVTGPDATILRESLLNDTQTKSKECSVDVDPFDGVYPVRVVKEETDEYIETSPSTHESLAMGEMNTAGGKGSGGNNRVKSAVECAFDDSTSKDNNTTTTTSGGDEKRSIDKPTKSGNNTDVAMMEYQDDIFGESDRYAKDRNTGNNEIDEHPSTSKTNQKVFKRLLTHEDLLAISKNKRLNDEPDLKAIKVAGPKRGTTDPEQNNLLKMAGNLQGRANQARLRNPVTKRHNERNIPFSNHNRDALPTNQNKSMGISEPNGPSRWLLLCHKIKNKQYDDPKLREVSTAPLDIDRFRHILEKGDDFFADAPPPTKKAASADKDNILGPWKGTNVSREKPKEWIVPILNESKNFTIVAPVIGLVGSSVGSQQVKKIVKKPELNSAPLTKYEKLKKQNLLQFLDDSIVDPNTHGGAWKCKACHETITTFGYFQKHCRKHITSKKPRKPFETRFEILQEHDMLRFLDESIPDPNKHRGDWKCRRCKITYTTFKSFQNHCTLHLERTIVCVLCRAMFHNDRNLRWHLKNIHQMQSPQDEASPPNKPRAQRSKKAETSQDQTKDAWAYERTVHTGRRLYVCEHCGRGFYNRQCINQHLESHQTGTLYTCKLCRRKCALERRKTRGGDRARTAYVCPVCDKAFLLRSNAVTHLDLAHGLTTSDVKIVARVRDDAEVKHKQQQMLILRRHLRDTSDPLQLPEAEFVKHFGLTQRAYHQVLNEIEPFLPAIHRVGVANELKLLAALSFYANGTLQRNVTTSHLLGMSQTTVSRCLTVVTYALSEPEVLNRHLKFPETNAERTEIKERFMEKFGFPDVVGCIFGTRVAIHCPNEQKEKYINDKGYYSINALLICDSSLRILYIDSSFGGATQDSFIWDQSHIKDVLRKLHEDGERCWLLGDSGHAPQPWLLPPISAVAPNSPEEHYNRCHSSVWTTVDRCVRTLKSRWRCLLAQRVLHYHSAKAAKMVNACAVLHNIANAHGIPVPDLLEEDFQADRERQSGPGVAVPGPEYDWEPLEQLVQELWFQRQ